MAAQPSTAPCVIQAAVGGVTSGVTDTVGGVTMELAKSAKAAENLAAQGKVYEQEFHNQSENALAKYEKCGWFFNFTTKWGCDLTDGPLRGPFLTISFVLIFTSVVVQKFAFAGMFDGSARNLPWVELEMPAYMLFWTLISNGGCDECYYNGGHFDDPFGVLNSSIPQHEMGAIDMANPLNPRGLPHVKVRQTLVQMCFYPPAHPGWSTNYTGVYMGHLHVADVGGAELCLDLNVVAGRIGGDFDQCAKSSDGMFMTLWMGALFGWAGVIDTFSRWNKWNKDGTPNDRGHIKCVGSFIFALTTAIDAAGFANYQFNCVQPIRDSANDNTCFSGYCFANVRNVQTGLAYNLLWLQFALAHTGDIFKILIPAIDVREMAKYGGAKTDYFGRVIAKGKATATADVELQP